MEQTFDQLYFQLNKILEKVEINIALYKSEYRPIYKYIRNICKYKALTDDELRKKYEVLGRRKSIIFRHLKFIGNLIETKEWKSIVDVWNLEQKNSSIEIKQYKVETYLIENIEYSIFHKFIDNNYSEIFFIKNNYTRLNKFSDIDYKTKIDFIAAPNEFLCKNISKYDKGVYFTLLSNFFVLPNDKNNSYEIYIDITDEHPDPDIYFEEKPDSFYYNSNYNDNADLDSQSSDFWESI